MHNPQMTPQSRSPIKFPRTVRTEQHLLYRLDFVIRANLRLVLVVQQVFSSAEALAAYRASKYPTAHGA